MVKNILKVFAFSLFSFLMLDATIIISPDGTKSAEIKKSIIGGGRSIGFDYIEIRNTTNNELKKILNMNCVIERIAWSRDNVKLAILYLIHVPSECKYIYKVKIWDYIKNKLLDVDIYYDANLKITGFEWLSHSHTLAVRYEEYSIIHIKE